jgi:putative ABC transport system substrate-binding protein
VFLGVSDPIGSGFVASLARPGGNVTGIMLYEPGVPGKWLAMLKEIAPRLKRVALIAGPKTTAYDYFVRNAETAGSSLGIDNRIIYIYHTFIHVFVLYVYLNR